MALRAHASMALASLMVMVLLAGSQPVLAQTGDGLDSPLSGLDPATSPPPAPTVTDAPDAGVFLDLNIPPSPPDDQATVVDTPSPPFPPAPPQVADGGPVVGPSSTLSCSGSTCVDTANFDIFTQGELARVASVVASWGPKVLGSPEGPYLASTRDWGGVASICRALAKYEFRFGKHASDITLVRGPALNVEACREIGFGHTGCGRANSPYVLTVEELMTPVSHEDDPEAIMDRALSKIASFFDTSLTDAMAVCAAVGYNVMSKTGLNLFAPYEITDQASLESTFKGLRVGAHDDPAALQANFDRLRVKREARSHGEFMAPRPPVILPPPDATLVDFVRHWEAMGMETEEGVALMGSYTTSESQNCFEGPSNDDYCNPQTGAITNIFTLDRDQNGTRRTCEGVRMFSFDNQYFHDACSPTIDIVPISQSGDYYPDSRINGMRDEEFGALVRRETCKFTSPEFRAMVEMQLRAIRTGMVPEVKPPIPGFRIWWPNENCQVAAALGVTASNCPHPIRWWYDVIDARLGQACSLDANRTATLAANVTRELQGIMRQMISHSHFDKMYAHSFVKMSEKQGIFLPKDSVPPTRPTGKACITGFVLDPAACPAGTQPGGDDTCDGCPNGHECSPCCRCLTFNFEGTTSRLPVGTPLVQRDVDSSPPPPFPPVPERTGIARDIVPYLDEEENAPFDGATFAPVPSSGDPPREDNPAAAPGPGSGLGTIPANNVDTIGGDIQNRSPTPGNINSFDDTTGPQIIGNGTDISVSTGGTGNVTELSEPISPPTADDSPSGITVNNGGLGVGYGRRLQQANQIPQSPFRPSDICVQTNGRSISVRGFPSTPYIFTPFQRQFTIPPLATPVTSQCRADGHCLDAYQIEILPFTKNITCPGPLTSFVGYGGISPGPTFRQPRGRESMLRFINRLTPGNSGPLESPREPCLGGGGQGARPAGHPVSIHLHGMASLAPYDGWAEDTVCGGESKDYIYPNNRPATGWYHDHHIEITANNVYTGMAGMYIIEDRDVFGGCGQPWNLDRLPDIPVIMRDVVLDTRCQLYYDHEGPHNNNLYGDINLVNGEPWPVMTLEPRWVRFRFLNGAASRPFQIRIVTPTGQDVSGSICRVIGSDGGLRRNSSPFPGIGVFVAVSERWEVVCDFRAQHGRTLYLINQYNDARMDAVPFFCFSHLLARINVAACTGLTPGNGAVCPTFNAANFNENVAERTQLDEVLSTADINAAIALARNRNPHRTFRFGRSGGEWVINGETWHTFRVATADENGGRLPIGQNTWEVWRMESGGGWFHPIHVHLVDFYILSREGGVSLQPYETFTPKDVFQMDEGTEIMMLARFGPHRGEWMFHCHNLVHEDHEMLRSLRVENPATNATLARARANQLFNPAVLLSQNVLYDIYAEPTTPPARAFLTGTRDLVAEARRYVDLNIYRIFYPTGTAGLPGTVAITGPEDPRLVDVTQNPWLVRCNNGSRNLGRVAPNAGFADAGRLFPGGITTGTAGRRRRAAGRRLLEDSA